MPTSLGQLMLNQLLPPHHRSNELLTKSALNKKLTAIAREDPKLYTDTVTKLKVLGDKISTLEGVSVGLDDIEPEYEARDKIMNPAMAAFKDAKTEKEREKIIVDAQGKMLDYTRTHKGTMTQMALSGARGNIAQLMKTVGSPVASADAKGHLVPWLVGKSYAEGLSPADYWVTGAEARVNAFKSTAAVAEPGDAAKIIVNTMYPLVITEQDCHTHNGIISNVNSGHTAGRYLAEAAGNHPYNTLLTSAVLSDLKNKHIEKLKVRSPMTCESKSGICVRCQGLDEKNEPHKIGVNVGVRAAQAMSEPLTQFALSSKHGSAALKGAKKTLEGLQGFRQILEIPSSFANKAILSEKNGTVDKIEEAPHGGHYVTVGSSRHYVGPSLAILVKQGQRVEAGDVLSEGVPKPDELIKFKGMGVGRAYMVDTLHDVYKSAGVDLDRRHLELLTRVHLSHVIVQDPKDHPVIRGDVITYDHYKDLISKHTEKLPLEKAQHRILGQETLHYTAGTEITPSLQEALKFHGIKEVTVAVNPIIAEPMMKSISRAPLLNPDWMARMSHRFLKDSLLKGAHTGESSNRHGLHPVPAYAYGIEFGAPKDGQY